MGKLINGLNGPFLGTVGSVIGSSRNGNYYMKGPYKKRTQIISEKEKLNRLKFSFAQAWLRPVLKFVRIGFNGYSEKAGGFAAAKSYLMKNALYIQGTEIIIDPALVKVSHGTLPLSGDAAVAFSAPNRLRFTWNPEDLDLDFGNDQVMMLAYNVDGAEVFEATYGNLRNTGEDILNVSLLPGSVLEVYIAFIAADRSRQSESLYLGQISL